MACAGFSDYSGDEFIDNSLTQASDELKEMYCEDCEKDLGTFVTADGFCADCVEYLCSTCLRYHKKHPPQQTLKDSVNMPQDFCLDKCTNHPKEIIKFYCNTCETTACPKCKTEKHKNHHKIWHIPTLVQSDKMADELRRLSLLIDQTLDELAAKKDRAVSSLTEVNSNKEDAITAIKMHRAKLERQVELQHKYLLDDQSRKQSDEIKTYEQKRAEVIAELDKEKAELHERLNSEKRQMIQLLQTNQDELFENIDKSEQDLENESEQMNQTDANKLQLILSRTYKTKADINEMKMSIDRKTKRGEKCELFVATKNVLSDIEKVRTDMQKNIKDHEIQNYVFHVQEDRINLKSTDSKVRFGCLLDKSAIKRTLRYEGTMKLHSSSDKKRRSISGLCQVTHKLVVVDELNASIKVIDTKLNIQISSKQLGSQPFDVTCVDDYMVATTLPEAEKILFLCLTQTGELSLDHEITFGKKCYGIEYVYPNFLVTCQDPGCVQIVSKQGNPIQTITGFDKPRYISDNQKNKIFNVEDTEILANGLPVKTIKKVSSDGKIITVSESFSDNQSGLAVDPSGSVYIFCCRKPRYSGVFSSRKNQAVQIIDTENTEYSGCVSCLFYCNRVNKLYAGTDNGEIQIFKIT